MQMEMDRLDLGASNDSKCGRQDYCCAFLTKFSSIKGCRRIRARNGFTHRHNLRYKRSIV